jgi:hypothetical protein
VEGRLRPAGRAPCAGRGHFVTCIIPLRLALPLVASYLPFPTRSSFCGVAACRALFVWHEGGISLILRLCLLFWAADRFFSIRWYVLVYF